MKKICLSLVLLCAFVLQFCTASKNSKSNKVAKITYMDNIQPIVSTSCAPCHIPPQGNKKAYNTYAAVKGDIDDILTRINRNPGEKGFMPMRHPKLSADTLNIFAKWKSDGLLESSAK